MGLSWPLQPILRLCPINSQFLSKLTLLSPSKLAGRAGRQSKARKASHANLISIKQRTAVAYWQAGQDKSPLVLEARARQVLKVWR